MNTTEISRQIAALHIAADLAALRDGQSLMSTQPIAMSCGTWDLEQDLIDIDSTLIASDLDEQTIMHEVCEEYRTLAQEMYDRACADGDVEMLKKLDPNQR